MLKRSVVLALFNQSHRRILSQGGLRQQIEHRTNTTRAEDHTDPAGSEDGARERPDENSPGLSIKTKADSANDHSSQPERYSRLTNLFSSGTLVLTRFFASHSMR